MSDYECGFERSIREILTSLQNKGVINKSYVIPQAGEVFNPQDVDFNKNVLNQFFQHSQDLGMELFEAYPAYTNINGRTFSLRNITKNFKDLDDMCWQYGRMIKFDQRKHEEILELLEYAKEMAVVELNFYGSTVGADVAEEIAAIHPENRPSAKAFPESDNFYVP